MCHSDQLRYLNAVFSAVLLTFICFPFEVASQSLIIEGTGHDEPWNDHPITLVKVFENSTGKLLDSIYTDKTGHYRFEILTTSIEYLEGNQYGQRLMTNPFGDKVVLQCYAQKEEKYDLIISNLSGVILLRQNILLKSGYNEISITGLGKSGLKMITLTNGMKRISYKAIQSSSSYFNPIVQISELTTIEKNPAIESPLKKSLLSNDSIRMTFKSAGYFLIDTTVVISPNMAVNYLLKPIVPPRSITIQGLSSLDNLKISAYDKENSHMVDSFKIHDIWQLSDYFYFYFYLYFKEPPEVENIYLVFEKSGYYPYTINLPSDSSIKQHMDINVNLEMITNPKKVEIEGFIHYSPKNEQPVTTITAYDNHTNQLLALTNSLLNGDFKLGFLLNESSSTDSIRLVYESKYYITSDTVVPIKPYHILTYNLTIEPVTEHHFILKPKTIHGDDIGNLTLDIKWADGVVTKHNVQNDGYIHVDRNEYKERTNTAIVTHVHDTAKYSLWQMFRKLKHNLADTNYAQNLKYNTEHLPRVGTPLKVTNIPDTLLIYLCPTKVKRPEYVPVSYGGDSIRMDHPVVRGMMQNSPPAATAKFIPRTGAEIVYVFQMTFNQYTGAPIDQANLNRAKAELDKVLAIYTLNDGTKLFNYEFYTINSYTDPKFLESKARDNHDNMTYTTFTQSSAYNGIEVTTTYSINNKARIKGSYSIYGIGNSNGQLCAEIYQQLASSSDPPEETTPWIYTTTGITEAGKSIARLIYFLNHGTTTWKIY